MKRLAASLLLVALLLSGCNKADSTPDSATLDEVALSEPSVTVSETSKTEETAPPEPPSIEDAVTEEVDIILDNEVSGYAELDVEELFQYPELPTGCESVALTIALNYLGCDLEKTDIPEYYLEYGNNFANSFVGDPYTQGGAGVFPPGIVTTVENYTDETDDPIVAVDTTGLDLDELYCFLDSGYPVLVWTTVYLSTPYLESGVNYNGVYYPWYSTEHCVCLYGYDEDEDKVMISDPQRGKISVSATQFERIYDDIGQFSVVLISKPPQNPAEDASEPAENDD